MPLLACVAFAAIYLWRRRLASIAAPSRIPPGPPTGSASPPSSAPSPPFSDTESSAAAFPPAASISAGVTGSPLHACFAATPSAASAGKTSPSITSATGSPPPPRKSATPTISSSASSSSSAPSRAPADRVAPAAVVGTYPPRRSPSAAGRLHAPAAARPLHRHRMDFRHRPRRRRSQRLRRHRLSPGLRQRLLRIH